MSDDTVVQLVEILFNISRMMKQEMSYSDNIRHLSILQIQTLKYLSKHQKVSMSQIAEYFRIELSSATSLINKLCEHNLVQRFDDPVDRRLVRLALTDEGELLMQKVIESHRNKLEEILGYLSPAEQSEFLNILKTLQKRLQN